jgi:hypothetical protein
VDASIAPLSERMKTEHATTTAGAKRVALRPTTHPPTREVKCASPRNLVTGSAK